MSAECIRCSGPASPIEVALFGLGAESGDDPDRPAHLLLEILGGEPDAVHRIRRDLPPSRQITDISPIGEELALVRGQTLPTGNGESA